jgi:argininosuccinate synthase
MFLKSMLSGSRAAGRAGAAGMARTLSSQKRRMSNVPIHPGPTGPDKRLVLAYSGGLDTSTQLRWLADKGYEVIAFCANLGQGGGMNDEDFSGIEKKALASGAKKCYVLDLQEDFVENYVFPIIRANAIYESRYLLGTSLARPCITKTLVRPALLLRALAPVP